MTSASDEKWQPFNCFFSRVGLRTYQHPGIEMYCMNCINISNTVITVYICTTYDEPVIGITATNYSIISYGSITFDLHLFDLHPLSQEYN
jgi:hypothetical protein